MADAPAAMPQNVRVRLNVGGTPFHTSLHTLMEGARRGCVVFQCLCVHVLGTEALVCGDVGVRTTSALVFGPVERGQREGTAAPCSGLWHAWCVGMPPHQLAGA